MGIYIFNKEVLIRELEIDAEMEGSSHDFGHDIIPRIFATHRVFGYQYQGYWRDVGTVESYWNAHMDLLSSNPPLALDDDDLRLRTAGSILAPARIGPRAHVSNSLISGAANVNGHITRSVISPGVIIEDGAVVRDSIIQHGAIIRSGAIIDRGIIDKEVVVGRDAIIGKGGDTVPNLERPDIVNSGLTIVGKRAIVPAGLHIGRNVVIGPGVRDELLDTGHLASGSSVHPTTMPAHLYV